MTVKVITVVVLCSLLVILRKTILSVDIRIFHWLVHDIGFPDYQGHTKGFLNLGEITYNITQNKLHKITAEYSEIHTSSLLSLIGANSSYLNISLYNGNASFQANWSYSMWPSLKDQGELTLDINNAFLNVAVKIYTDAHGLINFTVVDCTMRIGSVDVALRNASSPIYESMASTWQKGAKESLSNRLCKSLRHGAAGNVNSIIRNAQLLFATSFIPGDVMCCRSVLAGLGRVFILLFPTMVKILHDFGVTLFLMIALVWLYLVFEMARSAQIVKKLGTIFQRKRCKIKTMPNTEKGPMLQDNSSSGLPTSITLTSVAELVTTRQKNTYFSRFKRILWWKKPKEN